MDFVEPFVITIGRQPGSGGSVIGKMLAQHLNIAYYDKEILEVAAQESGLRTELFQDKDEKKSFLHSFFHSFVPFANSASDFYNNQISEESLFHIQSKAIKKIADKGSCVFIGRCADYILRTHPRCLNIFITAPFNHRLKVIMKQYEVDVHTARKILEQYDATRSEYYNFYSSGVWGEADNYDLCINSSVLGYEQTEAIIYEFVQRKLLNKKCE